MPTNTPKPIKNLFCPACNDYPDKITESVGSMVEREWNGDCYEMIRQENDEDGLFFCGICSCNLETK